LEWLIHFETWQTAYAFNSAKGVSASPTISVSSANVTGYLSAGAT
jgi:hypothetical protein